MATKYISPSGNDSTGDGSALNPYLTVTKARAMTSNGDTIYLLAGDYTVTHWPLKTSIANRIMQGAGVLSTVVDFESNGTANTGHYFVTGGTCELNGIQFKNGQPSTTLDGWFDIPSLTTLSVINCGWKDAPLAVNFWGRLGYRFDASTTGVTVNVIGSFFYNCTCYQTYIGHLFEIGGVANVLNVYNNCIYILSAGLLRPLCVRDGSSIARLKNNIFVVESGALKLYSGYRDAAIGTGNTITYENNCAYGSWSDIPPGTGNITSDPLLVDPANLNFNLRPSSPCIDTGALI